METSHEGTEWDDPHTGHSWIDPRGPFQAVRRLLLYGFVLALVVAVGGGAIGSFVAIYVAASAASTIGFVWLGLWFVDNILAYLKD